MPVEDHALQAFVDSNKAKYPVTGNKLWLFAEAQKVNSHSWESMKARYMLFSGASAKKGKKKPLLRPSLGSGTQGTIPFRPSSTSTCTRPSSTQTDGTGMVRVGVGIHLFCPVMQYRLVDVSTQTGRLPSRHRRSHSF